MFWLIRNPESISNKHIGTVLKKQGYSSYIFRQCSLLDKESIIIPDIRFEYSEKYIHDILPNSDRLFVVSNKVLNILNDLCPNDFQSFEIDIYIDDVIFTTYYIINILNDLEVLDIKKSRYTTISNSNYILNLTKPIYKVDSLGSYHIVRNMDYKPHILISDKLKNIFVKEKIKYIDFLPCLINS